MSTYKKILLTSNAHGGGYQPRGVTNITGWKSFPKIIAPLFAKPKSMGVESTLRRALKNIYMSSSKLYYDPARLSFFSTLEKLAATIPKKNF